MADQEGYDLSAAAAVVIAADADAVLAGERRGALAVWQALTGAAWPADALRLAESYAYDTPPTLAYVPPL